MKYSRFIEEYLQFHKRIDGRRLEDFLRKEKPGKSRSFGPFLSIHKQGNDTLKGLLDDEERKKW